MKSDTYDFYTRIYPIGKDGITPEWLTGKDYIDNFQYSSKIKAYVWKDERYTNTTSLIEDATAKIEEMSRPYKAYTAEVVDLAKASEEYKDILGADPYEAITEMFSYQYSYSAALKMGSNLMQSSLFDFIK